MKITVNWLKQYVDFDWTAEELAERLTMLGIEVEGSQKLGGEFEGIVVAQVATCDKHPNADKLSVCRVNDGRTERQIVCGAHNFKAGDKVALILPGFNLPPKPGQQPFTIKVGKIRGIESHGMMCSPQELGLPDQAEGLLILREDARVGQPFAGYLGRAGSDVVLDLEITPNRPDLNSLIGIAREISALTGNPLRVPELAETQSRGKAEGNEMSAEELVAVRIEEPELCPRYIARLIRGVKVGASPDWLSTALEKVGVRSINNVVDVTNFVMLEVGQPLHAFDFHLLQSQANIASPERQARPAIVIRRAAEGEKFITLDGQERKLTREMLLVADETKPVALAGIMGGQNSEINSSTVDVLIESAYFKPQNIRATSRKLELRTESSYRFERGSDIGICDWASRRAAQLILQTAGGTAAAGAVDVYPKLIEPKQVLLRPQKVKELLGIDLLPEQIEGYLSQLELKVVGRKPRPVGIERVPVEPVAVRIPTFRVDLKGEVDLIEEIARLYGVDRIPATPPRGALGGHPFDSVHDIFGEARRILTGLGLSEAQGQTLISDSAARLVSTEEPVAMANPLSGDMNVLRPSLLPGLLDALRHNWSHQNNEVALFELGRVFCGTTSSQSSSSQENVPGGFRERQRIALALTGQRNPVFWAGSERDAKFDVYDLKGSLEEFFEQFGLRGLTYARRSESTSLFIESATIQLGKFYVGEFGQLQPALARQYDLRDPVFLTELDLDVLLARRNPTKAFRALAAHPSIRRDVAMLVPETTTHEAVLQAIKQAKPPNLESVELFDIFRGKNVGPDRKSMAYGFTYRSTERTLTDAEVNAAHEGLVEQLKQKLRAIVRE
jgi:phenylalanyl-tRNA synthetase beta chain